VEERNKVWSCPVYVTVKRFKIFEVSLTWEEIKLSCINLLGEIDGGKEENNE
jgi:hypothetical protein